MRSNESGRAADCRDERLEAGLTKKTTPPLAKSKLHLSGVSYSRKVSATRKQRTRLQKSIKSLPEVDFTRGDIVDDDDEVGDEIVACTGWRGPTRPVSC